MRCDECGCDTVRQCTLHGLVFGECTLCGTRHADARTIEAVELYEWAEKNNVHAELLPLIGVLKKINGLKYLDSSGPDEYYGLAPSVYFQLSPPSYRYLEKLMQVLEQFKPGSGIHWTVDVSSRSGVSFRVGPSLPLSERKPTAEEIEKVRRDIPALADAVDRNMRLSWWEK